MYLLGSACTQLSLSMRLLVLSSHLSWCCCLRSFTSNARPSRFFYNFNTRKACWLPDICLFLPNLLLYFQLGSRSFPSPEAALLLVSTKSRGQVLSQVHHRKSAIHELPVTLLMLRVKSEKSDWFWSQSIVFTKPLKSKPECRWTWPEVSERSNDWAFAWTHAWFKHFRSISLFIPQNSTVNLRHSSHLGTKFNNSAPTNVLFPSFTA